MNLRPEEISSVIKDQIKRYASELDSIGSRYCYSGSRRYCTVCMVLEKAMQGELLEFPGEVYGMVHEPRGRQRRCSTSWQPEAISVKAIPVKTTGRVVEVPVGDALFGTCRKRT